jgi:uncharacterized membrane protein YeiH
MEALSFWIAMAGTVAFAVTAVLALAPRGIDLFGACVLGIITAIGGGTVRDLILGVPVFWATDLSYIWVALAASIATFSAHSLFNRKEIHGLMLYLDGLGVALFGIQAVDKVWGLEFGLPLAPIILGITTAIGGGLIRDVLAGRETLLMSRELYAVPVMLGCTLYVVLLYLVPDYRFICALGCFFLIFAIRAAAIHWNLSVPDWMTMRVKSG